MAGRLSRVFGQKASIQRLPRSKVVAHGVALMILETSHRNHLKEKKSSKKQSSSFMPFIEWYKGRMLILMFSPERQTVSNSAGHGHFKLFHHRSTYSISQYCSHVISNVNCFMFMHLLEFSTPVFINYVMALHYINSSLSVSCKSISEEPNKLEALYSRRHKASQNVHVTHSDQRTQQQNILACITCVEKCEQVFFCFVLFVFVL